MIYVQFSDSSQTDVVAVFSCPQDEAAYQHQGQVPDNDARYLTFISKLEQVE
ncbi:hypothetical protein [Dickeya dadantii]|uniref:hypothetical protein n=1 Tax=Dickeya dadantii TaxID=204038 RepID=UPI0003A51073|nr:hypothetical protein [Dickeya dadantii]